MGYASTTMVFYGIEVTNEQAENIYNKFIEEEGELDYDSQDTLTTEVSYVHRDRTVYKERNIPELRSDGTDSRVDSLCYDESSDRHILGIHMASKGYACDDKIEDYLIPSDKAIENYNKYILPILESENIEKKPSVKIITQVH